MRGSAAAFEPCLPVADARRGRPRRGGPRQRHRHLTFRRSGHGGRHPRPLPAGRENRPRSERLVFLQTLRRRHRPSRLYGCEHLAGQHDALSDRLRTVCDRQCRERSGCAPAAADRRLCGLRGIPRGAYPQRRVADGRPAGGLPHGQHDARRCTRTLRLTPRRVDRGRPGPAGASAHPLRATVLRAPLVRLLRTEPPGGGRDVRLPETDAFGRDVRRIVLPVGKRAGHQRHDHRPAGKKPRERSRRRDLPAHRSLLRRAQGRLLCLSRREHHV